MSPLYPHEIGFVRDSAGYLCGRQVVRDSVGQAVASNKAKIAPAVCGHIAHDRVVQAPAVILCVSGSGSGESSLVLLRQITP